MNGVITLFVANQMSESFKNILNLMAYAHSIASRSYDPKIKVGCVIADASSGAIIGEGYNGNPFCLPQVRDSMESGKSGYLHAEVRAALSCKTPSNINKEAYCTLIPCRECAKVLIELGGIRRIFFAQDSNYDASCKEIFKAAGIEVLKLEI
jgi:dCMP deaminase